MRELTLEEQKTVTGGLIWPRFPIGDIYREFVNHYTGSNNSITEQEVLDLMKELQEKAE